jgi:asparagine synthase (glutamine-hydrolysing)
MSIFGSRSSRGQTLNEFQLRDLAQSTHRYALDGTFVHATPAAGFGIQHFHTHIRSQMESLPTMDEHDNIVALDGRLDNHRELSDLLGLQDAVTCDSAIALHAFERWGEECFSKFVGEWAIALWSTKNETLYLARDHAGTRTLYFEATCGEILWSTYLDTFFANGEKRAVNRDYIIAYLSSHPMVQRTVFDGIQAVPAGYFVQFRGNTQMCKPHWQCVARHNIRYKHDEEYEEHFRGLFRQAVERRTGEGAPIIAELSGGMDSTSNVCMSDAIRTGSSIEELLDTISYFDDFDPSWNERPYFESVERQRGKRGIHLNTSYLRRSFVPVDPSQATYLLPGADTSIVDRENEFLQATADYPYRAILSGIGGDELLGGVPTPYPELADCLMSGQLRRLFRQAFQWSLSSRRPLAHLLLETVRFTSGLYFRASPKTSVTPPWILKTEELSRQVCSEATATLAQRLRLAPSRISCRLAWSALIETLPSHYPGALCRLEYRYPYLDRDLVEFLIAIPREQLIRPGRRRSLMRRALRNIVPTQILERKRKAFQLRTPLAALNSHARSIELLFSNSLTGLFCPLDNAALIHSFRTTCSGATPQYCSPLLKFVALELCLRSNSFRLRGIREWEPSTAICSALASEQDPI